MKKIKNLLTVAILATMIYGCTKPTPTIIEPGMATFKGFAEANLDETNDTTSTGAFEIQYEVAPEGTVVTFVVDGAELDETPDNSYNYPNQHFNATVDASGNFTISVPALPEGSDYTIVFDDFQASVKRLNATGDVVNEEELFTLGNVSESLREGVTTIREYTY